MKDGISDFIKFEYEHGNVKDVKEAFDNNPVEEEYHKGKIENVLKENDEI